MVKSFRESGNIEAALKHLQDNSSSIYDKIQLQELTGTYYLILENFQEAVKVYDELIKRNQENSSYFEHIIAAKQLTEVCIPKEMRLGVILNFFRGRK